MTKNYNIRNTKKHLDDTKPPEEIRLDMKNKSNSRGAHHANTNVANSWPASTVIKEYNEIYDGAAEIIFIMAEQEQIHRQNVELQKLQMSNRALRCGQLYGFVFAILLIICVYLLAVAGEVQLSKILAISGSSIFTAATIFSYCITKL